MTSERILVALETSGPVGSVAVAVGAQVQARTFMGERSGHAAGLIPALGSVLAEAGLERGDLSGVVVGSGPGSFTGVRVAAAAGKGLAHALDLPLYAVSSLLGAALTEQALPGGVGPWGLSTDSPAHHRHLRYVLFDARGDRVFAAAYRLTDGIPREVRAPRFAHLPEILADDELAAAGFCGDGAARHMAHLQRAGRLVLPPPLGFPSADGILRCLALDPGARALENPFEWEPDYLRETGAVRSRSG